MGLKGSKGSTHEGGIRVPAVIYWKGVLEKSISNQFFFSDDILPTFLTAAGLNISNSKFTGTDRWDDLINNKITMPKNVMTGNIIITDDRALYNDNWKLFYRHNVFLDSEKVFELYDVNKDPYEQNELSEKHPEVFNSMKETFYKMPMVVHPPNINPTQMYLYGDQFPDNARINGSPWLDREYEVKQIPSPFIQSIVFTWILFLTFKQITIPIAISLLLVIGYLLSLIHI